MIFTLTETVSQENSWNDCTRKSNSCFVLFFFSSGTDCKGKFYFDRFPAVICCSCTWPHCCIFPLLLFSYTIQKTQMNTPIICHFAGHSAPVRSVYVQDSEHCFLSASKDKTVKLWSLSNHGDGTAQSASSWTYYRHTRPVFHVGMVESVRHAVSCDGSLHVSYHSLSLRRGCLSTSIHRLRCKLFGPYFS